MNRWMILGLVLALSACDQAEPEQSADWREWCAFVQSAAEEIMRTRQTGVPMSKAMDIADPGDTDDTLLPALVQMAYEHPRYHSESVVEDSIRNFTDMAYRECAKEHRRQ